jgi:hypothetical protein
MRTDFKIHHDRRHISRVKERIIVLDVIQDDLPRPKSANRVIRVIGLVMGKMIDWSYLQSLFEPASEDSIVASALKALVT